MGSARRKGGRYTPPAPRLRFVRAAGRYEVWARGNKTFVVPGLPDDAPPEVLNALDRRRRATLTGRCDCGTRLAPRPGEPGQADAWHQQTCPAGDDRLTEIIRRSGWRP